MGNSPGTGEFPAQMASYAENVSIWWRHYVFEKNILSIDANSASWACVFSGIIYIKVQNVYFSLWLEVWALMARVGNMSIRKS